MRSNGIEVYPFSIRKPGAQDALSDAFKAAAQETFYLLDSPLGCLLAQIGTLIASPIGWVRALIAGQKLSPPGLKARLNHVAYTFEATRLARQMRQRGLNHVHVHFANNGANVALIATRYDPAITYSLTVHGPAVFYNVETNRLGVKAANAAFVRCISSFCQSQVMTFTPRQHWDRLHVVHCGLDTDRFQYRPGAYNGCLRLLTVGRLAPIKGYPTLLQACRRLSDDGVNWRLNLVGDGEMRPDLEALARQLEIEDRVQFSGAVGQDEIHRHFDEANVLVVPSFNEGVPTVLMEAMAKGMTVASTNVAGVTELVEEGVNGLLMRPASVDTQYQTLRRIAQDPQSLASFSEAARRKVEQEFSITGVGQQMAGLFRKYVFGNAD